MALKMSYICKSRVKLEKSGPLLRKLPVLGLIILKICFWLPNFATQKYVTNQGKDKEKIKKKYGPN